MPLFEYQCLECPKEFELLVYRSSRPTCPHCGSEKLEKKLSVFAANAKSSETTIPTGAGCPCGDPQGPCNN